MRALIIAVVALLVVALAGGSMYFSRRNEIVTKQEAIRASWSQVDVAIERRADLIPNLVNTVKGFAAHEEKAISDVAQARASLLSARSPQDRIGANERLDGALGRLLAIVENYPNLKANENFLRLQDELAGTENRIAVERRKYNQAVQDFNTYIQLFPNNLVASVGGFQRQDAYFKAEGKARDVPEVKF